MVQATLKDEFVTMDLYSDEASAIDAWATAWSNYFSDAETNGIPIQAAALPTAKAAMVAAMVGLSSSGAGAAKIQAGIQAWWSAIVSSPAAFWPGCTGITPPPGVSSIAAALGSVFASNTSGALSEEDAYNAVAGVLHPNNLGGLAAFPGPLSFPIL